jgi:dolichol-phosphate mannosyltransferase
MSTPSKRGSTLFVVLPAYNEEQNLPGLLEKLNEALTNDGFQFKIVVVDDGSRDATPRILEEYKTRLPLVVYRHEKNQGLGATIRDGLIHGTELTGDRDIIVTMDADETHSPGLILRMVRMIIEGHDVVIASRYQPGARVIGLDLHRRIISWFASRLIRLLFPTPGVRDFTCGYRAYRAAVLKQAFARYGSSFVEREGFECMVDILLKLRRMPLIFGEVPLILRYDLKGESKMRLVKTSMGTMRLLLKRRFGGDA